MGETQLGLTKIYNQFHNSALRELTDEEMVNIPEFTVAELQKQYGKKTVSLWRHLEKTDPHLRIQRGRPPDWSSANLHREMDEAVLRAYGWHRETGDGPPVHLGHDFHEVDYLPGKRPHSLHHQPNSTERDSKTSTSPQSRDLQG